MVCVLFYLVLLELPIGLSTHGPGEFGLEVLREDFFDLEVVLLAPGNSDPWGVVVDLGGAKGDILVA